MNKNEKEKSCRYEYIESWRKQDFQFFSTSEYEGRKKTENKAHLLLFAEREREKV